MTDVARAKAETIERAPARVASTWARAGASILDDFDAQDIVLLNLQRACEAGIDLALHAVAERGLGNPAGSREAFTLLGRTGWIDTATVDALRRMVGLRNVAVHEYRRLDWTIVQAMVEHELDALRRFASIMLRRLDSENGRDVP
ncbi:MAG: DUF86 domain-containing protein [Burkholderiales bacterium]|jgi:uncharacterized protein YutE (UPF0331/DUF86 family)|nr:DUF86 domain-containing protein [Burkholderiales bacterium]